MATGAVAAEASDFCGTAGAGDVAEGLSGFAVEDADEAATSGDAGFGAGDLGGGVDLAGDDFAAADWDDGEAVGLGGDGAAGEVSGAADGPRSSVSVKRWAQAEHFPVRPSSDRSGILKPLPQWGQRTRALVVAMSFDEC